MSYEERLYGFNIDECPEECELKGLQRGPVYTNYFKNNKKPIKYIIICESPSNSEFEKKLPTTLKTGYSLYKCLQYAGILECSSYCNGTNEWNNAWHNNQNEYYNYFEKNGIYITNMVRCQANYKLNKKENNKKNKRVQQSWGYCKKHLIKEIDNILGTSHNKGMIIVIAAGYDKKTNFNGLIEDELRESGLSKDIKYIKICHPSRIRHLCLKDKLEELKR